MGKLGIKFVPDESSFKALRKGVEAEGKRVLRNNFGDLRPFIEQAINDGVEASKDEFIPKAREIAELGIGAGGSEDVERTQGAYKKLRTDQGSSYTKFSVRKQRPTASNDIIGGIVVDTNREEFLNSSLAVVSTAESREIEEIPWMRWLIFGAPTNSEFRFVGSSRAKNSRTGGGIMVRGGVWIFPPARPGAFKILNDNIESRIVRFIKEKLGDVI